MKTCFITYNLKFKGFHLNQLNKDIFFYLLGLKKELHENFSIYNLSRLPAKTKGYTVMKSPDVNKSAREQFKTTFKRITLGFSIEAGRGNTLETYIKHSFFAIKKNGVGLLIKKKISSF